MSITRLALRQQLGAEETGLATLGIATSDGATNTVIASALAGPFSATRFAQGALVRFSTLNAVASTEETHIVSYAPATGTLTLLPALSVATKTADVFEIWETVDNVSEVDDAIDRGLTRHCYRWVPIPLTKVTDGDMGESGVAGLWTASAVEVTPSKVNIAFPDKIGRRYLRILNTTITFSPFVYCNNIPAVAGDVWRLSVLCKPVVGTASLVAYDITHGAPITLSGDGGSYGDLAPKHLDNTFTIPAGCKQWRPHLSGTSANADIYWTNIIAYPIDETQFVLPMRIANEKRVGNVLYRTGDDVEDFRFEPYCQSGRSAGITAEMGGVMVRLSHAPSTGSPAYVEELCTYDALSADTSTTDCNEELALACIKYEFMKGLANKNYALPTPQGYLAPSELRQKRDEALREMIAKQGSLGAQSKAVFR